MGRLRALTVVIAALLVVVGADYYSEEFFDDIEEFQNSDVPYTVLSVCADASGQLFTVDGPKCDSRVAIGKFKNTINQTGYGTLSNKEMLQVSVFSWSFLEIETSDEFSPEVQAYAGGVAEGLMITIFFC